LGELSGLDVSAQARYDADLDAGIGEAGIGEGGAQVPGESVLVDSGNAEDVDGDAAAALAYLVVDDVGMCRQRGGDDERVDGDVALLEDRG
jgi:hypothetical protein